MATPGSETAWKKPVFADWWQSDDTNLAAFIRLRRIRDATTCHVFGEHGGIGVSVGVDRRPSGLLLLRGLSARGALALVRLLVNGWRPEAGGFCALDAPPDVLTGLITALGDACAGLPLIDDSALDLPTAAA